MKKVDSRDNIQAEVTMIPIFESYGEGGITWADLKAEFPSVSGCPALGNINDFYRRMADKLRSYTADRLGLLGQAEYSSLGPGVARFRFRRYSLSHTTHIGYLDECLLSVLRTVKLARGSSTLSCRHYGEVIDLRSGRLLPPECFVSRDRIKAALDSRSAFENRGNYYREGDSLIFLPFDDATENKMLPIRSDEKKNIKIFYKKCHL